MNFNLTILERMVLETLQLKSKSLSEIEKSTTIEKRLLNKVINSLVSKNLIIVYNTDYEINRNMSQAIKDELNDKHALMSEIHEIINSCLRKAVSKTNQNSFKLKKVNMTRREEKIYDGLVYNLEAFLNSLEKSDQVAQQKIIFWGEGNYAEIKNNILNY